MAQHKKLHVFIPQGAWGAPVIGELIAVKDDGIVVRPAAGSGDVTMYAFSAAYIVPCTTWDEEDGEDQE